MASRRISDGALMTLVLLVSLVLTLLPVDPLLRAIWPHWTAMVMIYWVLEGNRLRFFPPWQQAVAVFALLSIDRLIALVVFMVTAEPWPPLLWYLAPVVGMVLWPWLFLALDALRQTRRLPS